MPPGVIEWTLWTNDGSGRFSRAQGLTAAPGLNQATWLDLELDGDLDLLLWSFPGQGSPIAVFENDGGGSFAPSTAALPAGGDTGRPMVLDADGDGLDDLLSRRAFGSYGLFLRRGAGWLDVSATHLPQPLYDAFVHDGNGDGAADLLDLHAGVYILNDTTGRFVERVPSGGRLDADLDGDGDPDGVGGWRGAERQLVLERPLRPGATATLGCHFKGGYNPAPARMWVVLGAGAMATPMLLAGGSRLFVDPGHAVLVGGAAVPAGSGYGQLDLGVPAAPALVGASVLLQGLVLDGPAIVGTNALQAFVH